MSDLKAIDVILKNGRDVIIRTANDDDAAMMIAYRICVLGESEFLASTPDDVKDDIDDQIAFIQRMRDDTGSMCLAAFGGDKLMGLLSFERNKRRKLKHRGSFGMTVSRDYWGLGIGSALLCTLLDWAQSNDEIQKVCLSVYATNERAIALYRRFSFREEGRLQRSFCLGPNRYDDELIMARFVD